MLDDSDMKIAGEAAEATEPACPVEALEQAQQNGNLEKAKQLGAQLAQLVLEKAEDTPRRSLLSFSAVVGMDSALPAGPTVESARNAFYEGLGAFYEELRSAGTFSFYYLCLQEGDRVEQQVGVTFAQLCGRETDAALAAEGTALYQAFLEESGRRVAALAFC